MQKLNNKLLAIGLVFSVGACVDDSWNELDPDSMQESDTDTGIEVVIDDGGPPSGVSDIDSAIPQVPTSCSVSMFCLKDFTGLNYGCTASLSACGFVALQWSYTGQGVMSINSATNVRVQLPGNCKSNITNTVSLSAWDSQGSLGTIYRTLQCPNNGGMY